MSTLTPLPAISDPALAPVAERVLAGSRLSVEDGSVLYETADLWSVCGLADLVRRRMHGDIAYYNVNRHLNYSNVCALSCSFCAFARKRDDDGVRFGRLLCVRQRSIDATNVEPRHQSY